MRVISGHFRSRKLIEVNSDHTRETKDRVKESIFNSIQGNLYDALVLDLFAGSGSLGIEAVSRGAKDVTFVDHMQEANQVIKQNITALSIEKISEIYFGDYGSFLEETYRKFDLILLDPPYKLNVLDDVIKTIAQKKLLTEDGIIVCLYSKNNTLKPENNGIIEYKKKAIGITNVSIMKWGI